MYLPVGQEGFFGEKKRCIFGEEKACFGGRLILRRGKFVLLWRRFSLERQGVFFLIIQILGDKLDFGRGKGRFFSQFLK